MKQQIVKSQSIAFNHFYIQFLRDLPKIKIEKARTRISQEASDLEDLYEFVCMTRMPKEEELEIYNQALWNVCNDYIVLADAKIDIIPQDLLEFINLILDTMEETPYFESFLLSLQFIYQEYFGCLNIGVPTLFGKEDEKLESYLEMIFNSNHQLIELKSINISLIDQNKIMTKMISMAIRNQIESISNPEEYKPSKVIIKQLEEK